MIAWDKVGKMEYQVEYDRRKKIVVTRVAGELTTEEAKKIIKKQVKLAREHHCEAFMSDFRDTVLRTSTVDIYYTPKAYEEAGLVNYHRRAFVIRNQQGDYDFLETVLRNAGWNVKMFTDADKAIDWLRQN